MLVEHGGALQLHSQDMANNKKNTGARCSVSCCCCRVGARCCQAVHQASGTEAADRAFEGQPLQGPALLAPAASAPPAPAGVAGGAAASLVLLAAAGTAAPATAAEHLHMTAPVTREQPCHAAAAAAPAAAQAAARQAALAAQPPDALPLRAAALPPPLPAAVVPLSLPAAKVPPFAAALPPPVAALMPRQVRRPGPLQQQLLHLQQSLQQCTLLPMGLARAGKRLRSWLRLLLWLQGQAGHSIGGCIAQINRARCQACVPHRLPLLGLLHCLSTVGRHSAGRRQPGGLLGGSRSSYRSGCRDCRRWHRHCLLQQVAGKLAQQSGMHVQCGLAAGTGSAGASGGGRPDELLRLLLAPQSRCRWMGTGAVAGAATPVAIRGQPICWRLLCAAPLAPCAAQALRSGHIGVDAIALLASPLALPGRRFPCGRAPCPPARRMLHQLAASGAHALIKVPHWVEAPALHGAGQ